VADLVREEEVVVIATAVAVVVTEEVPETKREL
jgi:hypothetical protein